MCIHLWKPCGNPVDKTPCIIIAFKRLKELHSSKALKWAKTRYFFFLLSFFSSVRLKSMTATADTFSMLTGDLKALARLFKKSPLKMGKVAAGVLNTEAFGLRTSILKTLDKEMTIRSHGFVKSRVRVVMARTGPIDSLQSESGSIFADRFDGWKSSQFGTEGLRKWVPSKFSRGGTWRRKVRLGMRHGQGKKIYKMSDFHITNAKNKQHRLIIYLQMLDKRKIKDRFLFPGDLGRMNEGDYTMKNGKIRGIHHRKEEVKRTKRTMWMDKSIDLLLKEVDPQSIWERNVKHVFRLR